VGPLSRGTGPQSQRRNTPARASRREHGPPAHAHINVGALGPQEGPPSGARLCQILPEPLGRQTWHVVDTVVARRSRRRPGFRAILAMSTTNVSPSITRSVPVCAWIAAESQPAALFPTCGVLWNQERTDCDRQSFTDPVRMFTDDPSNMFLFCC